MSAVAKIPRPKQLRGLLASRIKLHLTGSIIAGFLGGMAYKFGIGEPRKRAYAKFWHDYDCEASFERMRKKGVFDSVAAD